MITINDIASAAGVSSMTVYRVLNTDVDYRRPTFAKRAEHIRSLAKQMGYLPNSGAMAMRKGRFDCVSLLLSADPGRSLLPAGVLGGIQEVLGENNLRLSVGSFSDEKLTSQQDVPKLLRELSADGLLVNYNAQIPESMERLFESYRLPRIWINSKHGEDAVYPDDYAASFEVTSRLIELGHRRIAYINYNTRRDELATHYSFMDRWAGYCDAMERAGLIAYRYGDADWRLAGQIVITAKSLLTHEQRPTAAVCYGMTEARAMQMAAGVVGLSVPRDLSLVTFGDDAMDDLGPRVATAVLPQRQIGRQSVLMLLEKIAEPERVLPARVLKLQLHPGATLAAAPD